MATTRHLGVATLLLLEASDDGDVRGHGGITQSALKRALMVRSDKMMRRARGNVKNVKSILLLRVSTEISEDSICLISRSLNVSDFYGFFHWQVWEVIYTAAHRCDSCTVSRG